MTVFLVICCYTEPEQIISGIFSTRERAEAHKTTLGTGWPEWTIEEWEVDALDSPSGGDRDA